VTPSASGMISLMAPCSLKSFLTFSISQGFCHLSIFPEACWESDWSLLNPHDHGSLQWVSRAAKFSQLPYSHWFDS
jgi:hypothetical protein